VFAKALAVSGTTHAGAGQARTMNAGKFSITYHTQHVKIRLKIKRVSYPGFFIKDCAATGRVGRVDHKKAGRTVEGPACFYAMILQCYADSGSIAVNKQLGRGRGADRNIGL